jgi:hypothetical protein
MVNDIPQNLKYTLIGVEGVVEVNAHLVGGSLVDSLRRTFTIDSQMEQGDNFMDRSRGLLEKHLQLMQLREQIAIRQHYMRSVFDALCCAAESLKCDTSTYQGVETQTRVTLRQLQWLSGSKVLPSQKV